MIPGDLLKFPAEVFSISWFPKPKKITKTVVFDRFYVNLRDHEVR